MIDILIYRIVPVKCRLLKTTFFVFRAAYEILKFRGAEFLTPPFDREGEIRCFFRDPAGHRLEISEAR